MSSDPHVVCLQKGWAPLFRATDSSELELVMLLLGRGADLNPKDKVNCVQILNQF